MTAPRPAGRSETDNVTAATDGRDDFNFLHGPWHVRHRRRLRPLEPEDPTWEEFTGDAFEQPVLQGRGCLETLRSHAGPYGEPWEALTLRLFDPSDGNWRIWFTSTRQLGHLDSPTTGAFTGNHGIFFGDDVVNGMRFQARYDWHAIDGDTAKWEQSFSFDEGHTWTTNWIMDFTRRRATRPQS